MSSTGIDVSLIIPCFQEEGHIIESTKEIYKTLGGTSYSFELIFVDDKSTDNTRDKILEIEKLFPDVRYLFQEKNSGKGNAIAEGAKLARGKFIGHIDIDLEVSAENIPRLLAELEKGGDVALVKRKIKFSLNPKFIARDFSGMIHRSLVQVFLGIPRTDIQSGCKFFKRESLLQLLKKTKSPGWFFDVEIMTLAHVNNFRIKQIPGYYIRNKKKKSTVKLFFDGIQQLKNLFAFAKTLRQAQGDKPKEK